MLDEAALFLADQRDSHVARSVTYQRGQDAWAILATRGRTVFEDVPVDGGAVLRTTAPDFLVAVDGFGPGQPQAGDRILDGGYTYEVAALAGQSPYEVCVGRTTYRIHTKQVSP